MWHGGEVDLSGGGCGKYGLNMGKHLTGASSTVIFGTLASAGGAALTGGNVWQGAAAGAIVAGLNHVAHAFQKDSELVVLEDSEGASGNGHMALAGGNNKRGWSYLSKDGRADSNNDGNQDGTLLFGGKSKVTFEVNKYKTLSDLLKAYPRYELTLAYKVTYQQVQTAMSAGYQTALASFHFLLNNCGHAVHSALKSVGLYGGNSVIPNNRYSDIYYYMQTGVIYQSKKVYP